MGGITQNNQRRRKPFGDLANVRQRLRPKLTDQANLLDLSIRQNNLGPIV